MNENREQKPAQLWLFEPSVFSLLVTLEKTCAQRGGEQEQTYFVNIQRILNPALQMSCQASMRSVSAISVGGSEPVG